MACKYLNLDRRIDGRIKLEKNLYFNMMQRKPDKETEREKNEAAIHNTYRKRSCEMNCAKSSKGNMKTLDSMWHIGLLR